jgi:glycosyltransferase involved in cell wall biosynthesis
MGDSLFAESATAPGLMWRLDTPLPELSPGRGTAFLCSGACFHRDEPVRRVALLLDGEPQRLTARMPRLDLFQLTHPDLDLAGPRPDHGDPAVAVDPRLHCYRSGFWATVAVGAQDAGRRLSLELHVELESGRAAGTRIGEIGVVEMETAVRTRSRTGRRDGLIAVCLATFNPDPALFRAQIRSLVRQTDPNWICIVSDDGSDPACFDAIAEVLAGDPRFILSRNDRNLGYYRNFEHALKMVPADAELVALCDQDDRWYPEKLATLRAKIGGAQLAYSDQRLAEPGGKVLRDTLWCGRRNNHTDMASLLIANSITGAAMMMRRDIADLAVPFPDTPGWQFHDHWLALVGLASGQIAYINRPLYDYVQHPGATLGQAVHREAPSVNGAGRRRAVARRLCSPAELRSRWRAWRASYFYGYLAHEVLAQALLTRCEHLLTQKKRHALECFVDAQWSLRSFLWLAGRPFRSVARAKETLGTELEFARGVAWRHLVGARTGDRDTPFGAPYDATCPPLDSAALGRTRLARWRAGI